MSVQITRCLEIIELLVANDEGKALRDVAEAVGMTRPGAHRILATLAELGYVVKDEQDRYHLSSRLPLLGLQYSRNLINYRIIQPVLDRLAGVTRELVQMTLATDRALYWIAAAQGARASLRSQTDVGEKALLASTAVGQAWLSTLSEEQAIRLVLSDGFGHPDKLGPNAPRDVEALRERMARARERGYAIVIDSAEPGVSAVACPVFSKDGHHCVGTLGMAAPTARMTEETLHQFGRFMIESAPLLSDSLNYAAMALSIRNTDRAGRISRDRGEFRENWMVA